MNLSKTFLDFLKSDDKTLHLEKDNKYYEFVKISCNPEIDLLFVNYNNYHKITFNDELNYCGFYNKHPEKLYDINYTLKYDIFDLECGDKTYKSMEDLQKEFDLKVRETVENYVEDNKKEFYEAAKDYESNIIERNVYQNFMDNETEIKYQCGYNGSSKQDILSYFDGGEQYVFDVAFEFINEYRERIGEMLNDIDKKNELLKSIYNNPEHQIHKRKEIADIMQDGEYVNVHLFINKNGIDYDFKYNASVLKNHWDYSYLSTYDMQAPDKREFEKLFGPREDLHYEDIYKIEYRNKPIYEDKNFVKTEIEETPELALN